VGVVGSAAGADVAGAGVVGSAAGADVAGAGIVGAATWVGAAADPVAVGWAVGDWGVVAPGPVTDAVGAGLLDTEVGDTGTAAVVIGVADGLPAVGTTPLQPAAAAIISEVPNITRITFRPLRTSRMLIAICCLPCVAQGRD
jgi:hypothetical protein